MDRIRKRQQAVLHQFLNHFCLTLPVIPGYFSELRYASDQFDDFIEVAVPEGTDVSGYTVQIYDDPLGPSPPSLSATYSLGTSTQTIDGKDVYLVDSGTPGWSGYTTVSAVALVDDQGNVIQFVSFGQTMTPVDGDAAGLASTNIGGGDLEDSQSMSSDDGGPATTNKTRRTLAPSLASHRVR